MAFNIVLNRAGRTVNFNDSFWTTARSWPVIGDAAMTGSVSADAGGRPRQRRARTTFRYFMTARQSLPILILALLALPASAAWQTARTVASPDGSMVFLLERDDVSGVFAWSATRGGRALVTRGALGVGLTGGVVVGDKGALSVADSRTVDTTWTPPYGENAVVRDNFNEETLAVTGTGQGSTTVSLQIRAYNEGVALRYSIGGTGPFTVASEKTSFPLPTNAQVWTSTTAQGTISKVAIGSAGTGLERPLTGQLASDLFIACGEAGLRDHARMKFNRTGASTLVPVLSSTATYSGAFSTPWRYVRAAASAAGLLQGNAFMQNLNGPSEIADTSWIRPGKVLRELSLTTTGGRASIDWAAAHGVDFILFDAGWYGPEATTTNATVVNVDPARSPGPLDLQNVIDYGKTKGVGVILYVNHVALEAQYAQLAPLYKQWGVAGVKFGFVNVGSQQWTSWLHNAVATFAANQIMVNAHDEYRMTGVERSLPNYMTAEGVRGDEEITTTSETILKTLFTRCLAGAADQTNCYFNSRVATNGSHASQLAKSVCIYSPWQHLFWYDSPPASPAIGGVSTRILDVPELTFFQRLPTVWDETRWLDGHPDTHAVVARRKGGSWFLGAINGAAARAIHVPLDFLTTGQNYRLELFSDDPAITTASQVRIDTNVVDRSASIDLAVAIRNGFAAILTPTSDPLTPVPQVISFEQFEGYPGANTDLSALNGSDTNSPFDGIKGWSRSLSSSPGRIAATAGSGEYTGGQALGTNGSGTFVGGLKGCIAYTGQNTISFDAQYVSGIAVGFFGDGNANGLLDVAIDTGMGFGIGGTPSAFERRNAGFGTEAFSPLGGTTGQWYHFLVTIGGSSGGNRPVTMAVRNLTTGVDLDFDAATAGTQAWSGSVTDTAFGTAPELARGVFVRLSGAAKLDNLSVTAVTPPGGESYRNWIDQFPIHADASRAPGADPDGDGISNLLEFVLNGEPDQADPVILPVASVSGGNFVFEFHRRGDAAWGTTVTFQYTADLGNPESWQSVVIGATSGSSGGVDYTIESGAVTDRITVRVPLGDNPKIFARIRVASSQ